MILHMNWLVKRYIYSLVCHGYGCNIGKPIDKLMMWRNVLEFFGANPYNQSYLVCIGTEIACKPMH